jgi:CrcB protein
MSAADRDAEAIRNVPDPEGTLAGRDDPDHGPSLKLAIAEAEFESAPTDVPLASSQAAWERHVLAIAAVSVGGFCGAVARYLAGLWAVERWGAALPWGTLLINLSGSFVLGFYLTLVTERCAGRSTSRLLVATGFLGAYTTFSTFSYEVVQLMTQGHQLQALGYVAGSLVLGLAAAAVGMLAAHAR